MEIYRPQYHFTPPANWLNDPNGLVYFDGEYHLFYQYHPHSTIWGPMHWGHAVSRDLVHWEHLPIALYPDEHGMVFSGSAVVDWHNTAGFGDKAMVAIFTYNKEHVETQNLAYSTDRGRTWTKYAGNPVIPLPADLVDFRDPKVFWHTDHWVLALAAGDTILFYISSDLKHWEHSGSFGGGYGSVAGVWETPDLFELATDDGSARRWVLTVGVGNGAPAGGSGTQYFIGGFDGRNFTSENPKEMILWADHGADYYAPQSWNDEPAGRRIMLGWQSNWQYARVIPTSTWRGAFSVPRQLTLTQTDGGIRLIQRPIRELESLRGERHYWHSEIIHPHTNILKAVQGEHLEIMAEFRITGAVDQFGLHVRVGEGCRTMVGYNVKDQELFVARAFSGRSDFHSDFPKIHSVAMPLPDNIVHLHILLDSSSIEVFANHGLVVLSDLIFPYPDCQNLELFTQGGNVVLNSLDIYQLDSATFQVIEE